MHLFMLIAPVLFLSACGGTTLALKGSTTLGESLPTEESYSSKVTDDAPPAAAPSNNASAELSAPPPPSSASIPISIGGASLTCSLEPDSQTQASCFATDKKGKLIKTSPKDLLIASSKESIWTRVDFQFNSASSKISFQLPGPVSNDFYRVAAETADNVAIVGWVINPKAPPKNSVADGSFEENVLDLDNELVTQLVGPEVQTAWKALSLTGGPCLDIYELRSKLQYVFATPKDGNQVVELDSNCDGLGNNKGNNIRISQDIVTKAENYYRVSFFYQRRGKGAKIQALKAKFGKVEFINSNVQNQDWVEVVKVVKAKGDSMLISFEEIGDSSDGVGTQIDDVSVYDLGNLPKAISLPEN